MTPRCTRRLLTPAIVALLALGGVACSGDDDDATTSTPSSVTSTTDPSASSEGDDGEDGDDGEEGEDDGRDDGTTSTTDDDDSTSTTGEPPAGGLAARLPDLDGFEREIEDGDGDSLTDRHCDGSAPSLQPVEEAAAGYEAGDDGPEAYLGIAATRWASAGDATAAYEEFVGATSGCRAEGVEGDEGSSVDIGDEAMSWTLDFGPQGTGAIYAARVGDEIWFLYAYGGSSSVSAATLDAFAAAAEG